jgi:hypothetical protein
VVAPWSAELKDPAASAYAEALIAEGVTVGSPLPADVTLKGTNSLHKPGSVRLLHKGVEFVGEIRPVFAEVYQYGGSGEQLRNLERLMLEAYGPIQPSDVHRDSLPTAGYQRAWRLLNDLPQLFIAV